MKLIYEKLKPKKGARFKETKLKKCRYIFEREP